MAKVASSMSVSLDGYVTGPNDSREHPLGEGGERLHRWLRGADHTPADAEVLGEMVRAAGAVVMGRRSYDICEGDGGWGAGGPVGDVPCFVVTHHPPATASPVFTFVTDGVPSAIAKAKAVAGEEGWVGLHGATTAQQALAAGLVDEIQVHLIPVLMGAGVRLFDDTGAKPISLERTRVVETPQATHIRYRVVR